VAIAEEQAALLAAIEPEWARFQTMLDDAGGRLDKAKDSFREKVHP
jgi:hypothetical protein